MTERQFRDWAASLLSGVARLAHDGPVNILVLSGGGGAGAFSAGVLAGWEPARHTTPSRIRSRSLLKSASLAPLAIQLLGTRLGNSGVGIEYRKASSIMGALKRPRSPIEQTGMHCRLRVYAAARVVASRTRRRRRAHDSTREPR